MFRSAMPLICYWQENDLSNYAEKIRMIIDVSCVNSSIFIFA